MSKNSPIIDTYGSKDAPDMAKFGRGSSDRKGINDMIRQRDQLRRDENTSPGSTLYLRVRARAREIIEEFFLEMLKCVLPKSVNGATGC